MARVRGTNGVWYVTPEVTGLTFNRQDGTVKVFKPKNSPEHYWARDNNWVGSQADVTTLSDVTQAFLLVRTWNGYDGRHNDPNPSLPITAVNGNNLGVRYGRDHNYSFDMLPLSTGWLKTGTNDIQFWADSKNDHGVEVMWPGPGFLVKYSTGTPPPTEPDPPTLASPMDGATGASLNPVLSWNSVSNADSYKLQVASDAGFTSLVADLTGLTETTRAVGPLTTETQYYWRVRGTNAVGDGAWSVIRSFTTRGPVAQAPWWNSAWRYRIPITVPAGAYDRYAKPVELPVNFTAALTSLGAAGALDEGSLRLIEVSEGGGTLDTAMACQFDRGAGYNASANASGTVTFLMKGLTPAGTARTFHLYFETIGAAAPVSSIAPEITVTDNVDFEGQSSYRIQSAEATWYYHKQGGGFAGMRDKENREWLGYHPYGGSDGAYRGIPNMVFNTNGSDFFHPGFTNSTSTLISSGPVKVSFRTTSTEPLDPWECVWDVYPGYARMRLVATGRAGYWFLYEGTPGGSFEASTDYVVRSTGSRTPASASWEGDIPSPEWVYFGDGGLKRVLFLVNHEADTQPDSYRQQDGLMTVFGFGRSLSDLYGYMSDAPRTFTVGFAEDSAYATTSKVIASAYREISASAGAAERLIGTPALLDPSDGSGAVPTAPLFRWSKIAGATGYHLQVSASPDFLTGVAVNDSTIVDTTYQASALQPGSGYSWRVRAIAVTGKGSFSAAWQFTTTAGVTAPLLVSPPQGATGQPTTVLFVWRKASGATRYVFELATDSTFASGIVKYDSTLTDTSRNVLGLLPSTVHYWRVGTRDAGGLPGGTSETRAFRTAGILPSTVTLVAPADNAVLPGGDVTLRWNTSVPGVTRYWVEVALDSLFALRLTDSLVTDTTKALSGLQSNARYWWKVRAWNTEGWGSFSLVRSFVHGTSDVSLEDGIPSAIFLDQNYPNPFNPSTIIRFGVPGESRVKLEVFTVLGERVATLVDGTMGAGIYSVTFHVDGSRGSVSAGSSGIYFYRLSVGGDVRTRKMLILK
jgi:hypothetical protein